MPAGQRRVVQAIVLLVLALIGLVELEHFWLPAIDRPPILLIDDLIPGYAFALAGLVAWSQRPWNRVGTLMVGIGLGLLVGTGPVPTPSPLGEQQNFLGDAWTFFQLVFGLLWAVALFHLLLVFREGGFVSGIDRRMVRSLYVVVPMSGLALGVLALVRVQSIDAYLGPASLRFGVIGVSLVATFVYYLGCWVLGLGLVIRRWVRAAPARRRSMSPVAWSLIPIVLAWLGPFVTTGPMVIWGVWPRLVMVTPLLLVALPVGIVVALLRSEHEMSSVGDLVVKLSDGMLPEQLQPALAKTLHDPSLEVLYWLPTLARYADLNGETQSLPAPNSSRAATVLGDPGGPVAALLYDSSLRNEARLVDTAAAAVRLALENARLQVQLRAQLDEVQQSRMRLVEAADNERRRVERDLHDGAQQQLVTLLLSLQLAKGEALRRSDSTTAQLLDSSITALRQALDELRRLARGIHPTILAEAGLMPAISSLADRCPIPIEVTGELDRIEQKMETGLYFVAAQRSTNAVQHRS